MYEQPASEIDLAVCAESSPLVLLHLLTDNASRFNNIHYDTQVLSTSVMIHETETFDSVLYSEVYFAKIMNESIF